MTWSDFPHLQPLLRMVRGLPKKGLTSKEIMQTFLSCGVQPLHRRVVATGMFPGLGYPARPSFPRSGGAETDTKMQETISSRGSIGVVGPPCLS
jgi:hypothetical protein